MTKTTFLGLCALVVAACPSLSHASAYSDAVLADNPVAYYRLDGTTNDFAANAGSGGAALDANYIEIGAGEGKRNVGQAGPRPGDPAGSFPIDGLEEDNKAVHLGHDPENPTLYAYMERPDFLGSPVDITGGITLEAWIYRDPQLANGNNEGIVGRYQGSTFGNQRSYSLYYNPRTGGGLGFVLSDNGSFQSGFDLKGPTIPEGEWTHIAATFSPSTRMALFINGALVAERTDPTGIPAAIFDSAAPLWIGAQFSLAANTMFEGKIDEVAVYNTTLSDAAILAHYETAVSDVPLGIAGDFDDDSDVDGDDFLIWQREFGAGAGSPADGNSDGAVDALDLADWQMNYGATPPPPISAVPEPATTLLAFVGGAVAWTSRRGKRRRAIRKSLH